MLPTIDKERLIADFLSLTTGSAESLDERRVADLLTEKLNLIGFSVSEDDAGQKLGGNTGNLYGFLKGTIPGLPLLLSAHMDTVKPGENKHPVLHEDGTITSDGTTVLGADDAAGIVEILEGIRCVQEAALPHRDIEILFPVAEEIYIQGSGVFDFSQIRAKEAYVLDMSGEVGSAAVRAPSLISFQVTVKGKASHAGFAPENGIHVISSTEPYSPGNDLDVHRLSAQLTIISRDHIRSIGELEGKIETAKASYEQARQEINILTTEQERLSSLIQQAKIYFDLSGRTDLTDMEQLRLTVSRQSMLNNGISEKSDLDHLEAKLQEIEKQIASLKEQHRKCQQKYTIYADIAKTYREISQGDYISKLTEEERKRQTAEKSRRKKMLL